jgi:hypothetical protein
MIFKLLFAPWVKIRLAIWWGDRNPQLVTIANQQFAQAPDA